jgi:hypothetical protein
LGEWACVIFLRAAKRTVAAFRRRAAGGGRPGVVWCGGICGSTRTHGSSVPPGPLRWSGALDLSLASRPARAITGRIGIAGIEYRLTEQPAMTCHYWGRNLPSQWVWLSSNDFDRPGTGVEIGLIRSDPGYGEPGFHSPAPATPGSPPTAGSA